MLTKDDVELIGKVVERKIEVKLEPIKKQLDAQGKQLNEQEKSIKSLQKNTWTIRKDVKVMLDFLNKEDVRLLRRIERQKEHAGLPHPE